MGKSLVQEIARLYQAYADASALEVTALKAAMICPALILQKPHRASKTKEHVACVDRRLTLWKQGNFLTLLEEGNAIQHRLSSLPHKKLEEDQIARKFAEYIMHGKLRNATRFLSEDNIHNNSPLSLDTQVNNVQTVRDILREKHPARQPLHPSTIIDIEHPPTQHSIIIEEITGTSILNSTLHTEGSAGPSGLDASAMKRMCTSFQTASFNLCEALAKVARRIASSCVDPEPLKPLTACRLIALDKCPGVRPIGIGEVSRRIISKAVLSTIQHDIRDVIGSRQLCVGQKSVCEAAVHAVNDLYRDRSTEGILLVDASNAFNSLNRNATLANAMRICPALGTILVNTYRSDPRLYIDGETILSSEGTTQGDPIAMAMYAVGTLPLIQQLEISSQAIQVWYADDSAAGGKIECLRQWWDKLQELGQAYGYYTNSSKTWLVVKEEFYEEAVICFEDTDIQITTEGRRYLGSTVGTNAFTQDYVRTKVAEWESELEKLTKIASSQPHMAYCSLTQSMKSRWSYLLRTTTNIAALLQPIEDILRQKLIPAITGKQHINDEERKLLALPPRLGGLGIDILTQSADRLYKNSRAITDLLTRSILEFKKQDKPLNAHEQQKHICDQVKRKNNDELRKRADETFTEVDRATQRAMELAQEKGASVWLTTLPLQEHNFALHKGQFRDAIALRYGWRPNGMAIKCACGMNNSVAHALSCTRGGYVIRRHDEIRDLTATLLRDVSKAVETEPSLQPLTGEALSGRSSNQEDNSRLDIKCTGFWNPSQDAFLDVRVFNPLASSNLSVSSEILFRRNEREKRRAYDQRVCEIEHACFTPLVFSVTGGIGPSADIFYKRLAHLIANAKGLTYAKVISWIRCCLRFSLLRSAITAIRGTRPRKLISDTDNIILSSSEARLASDTDLI